MRGRMWLCIGSLISKIKLDPEYKKLWKKNVKPPVKWTRKEV